MPIKGIFPFVGLTNKGTVQLVTTYQGEMSLFERLDSSEGIHLFSMPALLLRTTNGCHNLL